MAAVGHEAESYGSTKRVRCRHVFGNKRPCRQKQIGRRIQPRRCLSQQFIQSVVRLGQAGIRGIHRKKTAIRTNLLNISVSILLARLEGTTAEQYNSQHRKIPRIYAIPAGIALVVAAMLFLGLTAGLENRIYDAFLGWRPSPPQDKNIVLVDVDDLAVSTVGTWPISRSITADALLLLKEMGSRYAVFDIEYVNKSPRGVNASALEETFPGLLTDGFSKLTQDNAALIQSIRSRRIPLSDAPSFCRPISAVSGRKPATTGDCSPKNCDRQRPEAGPVGPNFWGRHSDGPAARQPRPHRRPRDQKDCGRPLFPSSGKELDPASKHVDISPTIDPILSASLGLGFTNVTIDNDGVRRRIELLKRYGTTPFPNWASLLFSIWSAIHRWRSGRMRLSSRGPSIPMERPTM